MKKKIMLLCVTCAPTGSEEHGRFTVHTGLTCLFCCALDAAVVWLCARLQGPGLCLEQRALIQEQTAQLHDGQENGVQTRID